MIPRFHKKPGASFKGAVHYLIHDAGHAKTAERVAWTHTRNLANDHVPSAVDEMLWTFRNAELLKHEAGVRSGGTKVDRPVKHLSLNWAPGENVDRTEMIAAATSFLERMKWHDYQCIIFCHTDRAHPHIHLVINMIHPETGRRLDESFERVHAQKWAAAYEQERGHIFCAQRLLPFGERDAAPPRPVWQVLEQARKAHERADIERFEATPEAERFREDALNLEWRALKEIQRDERLAHFADGKAAFKALRIQLYRDIRKEFAADFRAVYAAAKAGVDPKAVAALKAEVAERQRAALELRRDAACEALRHERDETYRQLLNEQKSARDALEKLHRERTPGIDLLVRMAQAVRIPTAQAQATELASKAANENKPGMSGEEERTKRPARGQSFEPTLWSDRAGLVQQQRSAARYLEQTARRMKSNSLGPGGKTSFDRAVEPRVATAGVGSKEAGRSGLGVEPGPD